MSSTVTLNALIKRINRKLAQKQKRLATARGRTRDNLGPYYVLDTYSGNIDGSTSWPRDAADVAKLAREIGVMHPSESVA